MIDEPKRLRREIPAWKRQRNAARSCIKWMFTAEEARAKMGHANQMLPNIHNRCAETLVLFRTRAGTCERAALTNRPSLDLSPIVLKCLESLSESEEQIRRLPQPALNMT